jgi:membrane-bound metal-dependent hydrolase YbcI (DUF457 family)
VGAALVPDIDLLFRFVDGRNHHNNETHSIGFAVMAALVAACLARWLDPGHGLRLGLATGAAWLTHVVLDYLNRDTHPPIGILALWPFSPAHYKFPWPIFLDIGRTLEWSTVRNNAIAALWEMVILLPILWTAWRVRFGPADRSSA